MELKNNTNITWKKKEKRLRQAAQWIKKKGSNTSVNSKKTVDNRVVLNVGMVSKNKEGKLVVKRGSKVALKVRKDEGAAEVRKAAVKKHSDHDQFFHAEDNYIL